MQTQCPNFSDDNVTEDDCDADAVNGQDVEDQGNETNAVNSLCVTMKPDTEVTIV